MSVKRLVVGLATSLLSVVPQSHAAQAYPVDCAILLCLAGGWPGSAVCAHARAVFIERITPFPIEPPLQIWNCPMRAKADRDPVEATIWSIAALVESREGLVSSPWSQSAPQPVADRADIDISDPAYDFVRSIRVFHIRYSMRRSSGGSCTTSSMIEKGVYGTQGDFKWVSGAVSEVPKASKFRAPVGCQNYTYRSVFVDWRGSSGRYGKEELRY